MKELTANSNNGLPEGWRRVRLGELVDDPKQDLVDGPFGSNLKADEYVDKGVPVFKIQNIKANRFVDKNLNYVTEEKAKSLARHSFKVGDIIITKLGDPLGLCCKVPTKYSQGIIVADLMRLRPSKTKVYDNYLVNVINSEVVQNQFKAITKGTTRPRVNLTIVRNIQIPIPPINEQKKIVYQIEEIFSELDKGIEQLKTVQRLLKIYRQAVLKRAFEEKFTNRNLKKVRDVAQIFGGFAFKSGDFKTRGKYQVIRMGNVRPGLLRLDESPVFLNSAGEKILEKSSLQVNDVIITQTGTRKKRDYGFTALIPKSNLLLNQRIAAIRVNKSYLPRFFLYYSWTDFFRDQFFANETGNVGQGNVGIKAVTETLIPFCPIEEQKQIVQEIESRLSIADKLESTVSSSWQQVEVLRQSILKRAFEGRLV